jgi:hypothetical protein
MRHFVPIANRQINTAYILATEGCLPQDHGNVMLFLDQRATAFLKGVPGIEVKAAGEIRTLELTGEAAKTFRTDWLAMGEGAPQTGKTASARS